MRKLILALAALPSFAVADISRVTCVQIGQDVLGMTLKNDYGAEWEILRVKKERLKSVSTSLVDCVAEIWTDDGVREDMRMWAEWDDGEYWVFVEPLP